MKKLIPIAILIALSGCRQPPVSSSISNNPNIKVELMFEHEGIKVYRFEDAGRAIYYTDARGVAQWETGGKSSIKMQVETNR